ncbi:MAG TPA: DoxX family protein [bacterium]|nr:DoxX family protein [bacterium]
MNFLSRFAGPFHALLRIVVGLLFMPHGAQKLFGMFGGMGGEGGTAKFPDQMFIAGVLEFFGGLLLVLGLFTRPVALLLAIEMLVAYFMAHAPHSPIPLLNHGELALLYFIVFLYLSAAGPGAWSADEAIRKKT